MVCGLHERSKARIVLIDFGYSAVEVDPPSKGKPGTIRGLAGSPEYAAPEVLTWLAAAAGAGEGELYSGKADLWSAGVVCFVLMSARLGQRGDPKGPWV